MGFVLNDFAKSNQILCYYFREHKVGGYNEKKKMNEHNAMR